MEKKNRKDWKKKKPGRGYCWGSVRCGGSFFEGSPKIKYFDKQLCCPGGDVCLCPAPLHPPLGIAHWASLAEGGHRDAPGAASPAPWHPRLVSLWWLAQRGFLRASISAWTGGHLPGEAWTRDTPAYKPVLHQVPHTRLDPTWTCRCLCVRRPGGATLPYQCRAGTPPHPA